MSYHGSYNPSDVTFLLNPNTDARLTTIEIKEDLMAAGVHYSDLVVKEEAPSGEQIDCYLSTLDDLKNEMALGVLGLAKAIAQEAFFSDEIVLISLVRAGTPLGVLLKHALENQDLCPPVSHYGVSIIRDRGIDQKAMIEIKENHPNAVFYFVDGWTGKGTITKTLKESIVKVPGWEGHVPRLVVYSDPACKATLCATRNDMVLPFSVLNSTIAGLISRSFWVEDPESYHGVYEYTYLAQDDFTKAYIELMKKEIDSNHIDWATIAHAYNSKLDKTVSTTTERLIKDLVGNNPNKLKMSISETVRALLRRNPKQIYISSYDDPEVQLIIQLAKNKGVPIQARTGLGGWYKALAILN